MSLATAEQQKVPGFRLADRVTANRWRLSIFFGILALFTYSAEMREVVMAALSDAYFQVTVFVAATLALVFWFEKVFAFDLGLLMRNNLRWQPLIASALGVIPGCGGAIIVVTQFTKGYASFGAFIAVLVSTMGDAAILLVGARSQKPRFLSWLSVLLQEQLPAYLWTQIHGRDFMAVESTSHAELEEHLAGTNDDRPPLSIVWTGLAAIGIIPALLIALAYDPDAMLGAYSAYMPVTWLGFLSAMFCIGLWSISKRPDSQGLGSDTRPNDGLVNACH